VRYENWAFVYPHEPVKMRKGSNHVPENMLGEFVQVEVPSVTSLQLSRLNR
jgi:hypothetical protein